MNWQHQQHLFLYKCENRKTGWDKKTEINVKVAIKKTKKTRVDKD